MNTIQYCEVVPFAGIYVGFLKIENMTGGYYAKGKTYMEVITKLLVYARLDGHIK